MNDSKNKGWIRLHRKIEENSLWFLEPFTKAQAWVDLFLNANHKDGIIAIRGNVIPIKRGQIGWSELTMVSRWKWSKNRVRRFLKLLEVEQQIKQQKDRYITTIITILNYENYQSDIPDDTAERQQKDSRRYINKNDKNEKNDNKGDKESELRNSPNEINDIISLFKEINPSYERLYKNKTERDCVARLLGKGGREKLEEIIAYVAVANKKPYAPTITTPYQLEVKMGDLMAFYEKDKEKSNKNKVVFIS